VVKGRALDFAFVQDAHWIFFGHGRHVNCLFLWAPITNLKPYLLDTIQAIENQQLGSSNELLNLCIYGIWRSGGGPAVDDVSFLIDQEFLEIPLGFGVDLSQLE
jgi:hypothetical protein